MVNNFWMVKSYLHHATKSMKLAQYITNNIINGVYVVCVKDKTCTPYTLTYANSILIGSNETSEVGEKCSLEIK